jgi:mannose-1-phosphate guanylyltransferase
MLIAVFKQPLRPHSLEIHHYRIFHSLIVRNMSGAVSYAAAVSTPNGSVRQPQIQARACSFDDTRSSLGDQKPAKPQRPGAGIRSKTSFRGWTGKKTQESSKFEKSAVQYHPRTSREEQRPNTGKYHARTSREEHRPNTEGAEDDVYVLTLKLTESLEKPMNEMRQQYFPTKLNRTPAHLTLFHALPHSQMEVMEQGLTQLASSTTPFSVTTGGPFRMKKGVGVNVDEGYQTMKSVHGQLKNSWFSFLSEQDAGGFRPHWTVMNKVDEEKEVDAALHAVRQTLSQRMIEGHAVGLTLWKYDRGNWLWAKEFAFGETQRPLSRRQTSASPSGHLSPPADTHGSPGGAPNRRPGLMKRGSSVVDAWRSMSFLRRTSSSQNP